MTDPRAFDDDYRAGGAPWDIGVPQPEVVRLADERAFRGSVLDVGCGTGENALLLGARGLDVMGVDAAPTAIALAREKAAARRLDVPFEVADALGLGVLRRRFETVLDCGLFHVFDDAERVRYAASLAEVTAPGARAYVLCFSEDEPPGWGPRRVSEWDLRSTFRGVFVVSAIRPGLFQTRLHPAGVKAWVTALTRL